MRISTATLMGHLDMALSNYAKGFRNLDDITDYLFPRVPVLRQSDKYWIFGKENMQLTEQTLRATGSPAQQTKFSLSTGTYYCASHALQSLVADEERMAYTVGDLNMDAVQLNQDKILLDRQYRAMQKVTNTANYANTNTVALSGTAQWDNAASTPLAIASTARKVVAMQAQVRVNSLVLGFNVAEALRNNPQLIQRFQYNVISGALSDAQLAQVFNVDRVIVGGAVTIDPITGLSSFIWSNFALFCYINPATGAAGVLGAEGGVGPKQVSLGKSFTWTAAPQTVDGYGVIVARHPEVTAKSDIVGVDWYSDEQLTAPEAGYLVTNVLATP